MIQSHAIRSVRDQIADRLRNEILAEEIPCNQPLREAVLAERFGTSRGPIRDVLLQLSQEGALVYKPNAGVRVSPPLEKDERNLLMGLRRQIENRALPVFMARMTETDQSALRDLLEVMKRVCQKRDMPGIVGADLALHRYFVIHGSSSAIEAVWQSIVVRIRMAYSRLSKHQEIYREHQRIADAVLQGDRSLAIKMLNANLI